MLQALSSVDDTSSGCKVKNATEVLEKLEEDAANIVDIMGSNGLVNKKNINMQISD